MIQGKNGIQATVVADSVSANLNPKRDDSGEPITNHTRITTLQLRFHRFILPEFNTHRVFSRNASSSRAIPVKKLIEQVRTEPATPVHWGANQSGMQAKEECFNEIFLQTQNAEFRDVGLTSDEFWEMSAMTCSDFSESMSEAGYHKQIVNRLTEPFQFINVIVTSTEWENFFDLRLHPDAQPEIQELAKCMKQAMDESVPQALMPGQWHLPYLTKEELQTIPDSYNGYSDNDLRMFSAARCARVSYLNHDQSKPDLSKDYKLAVMLKEAGHMSPFEHQAHPIDPYNGNLHDDGVTHMTKNGDLWSGNLRNWLQFRQYNWDMNQKSNGSTPPTKNFEEYAAQLTNHLK